jgi:hypothetical protein
MKKMLKKIRMMKKGQIMMNKVRVDEKWRKQLIWLFSGKYGKM